MRTVHWVPAPVLALGAAAWLAGCTAGQTGAGSDGLMARIAPYPPGHWVQVLKTSDDPDLRRQAYLKLARPDLYKADPEVGRSVVSLYALGLQSEQEVYVRAVVARCLSRFASPESLKALRFGTADSAPAVRVDACASVGEIRQDGGDTILAGVLADDPEPDVRVAAAGALERYPTGRSVAALVRSLGDKDIAVRRRARLSLESITAQRLGDEPAPWRQHLQSNLDEYPESLDEALRAQQRRRPTPPKRWYYLYLF